MTFSAPLGLQRLDQFGHQHLVPDRRRRDPDEVDLSFHRHIGSLIRRLEERPGDDVEAETAVSRGDDLRAAIVPVLAELGYHYPRLRPERRGESSETGDKRDEFRLALIGAAMSPF
jgi:hypothetical protein